ncbi:hypothetical protein ACA910_013777 [Epithemia clementina (nom. ined.)]
MSCGCILPQMNGGHFLSRSSLSFLPSFLSSGQENSPSSLSVSPPLVDILQQANELAATLESDGNFFSSTNGGDFFSSTNGTNCTTINHALAHQAFLDSNSPASINMAGNHVDKGEDNNIIPEADLAMVTTTDMLPFDSYREGGLCSLEMNPVSSFPHQMSMAQQPEGVGGVCNNNNNYFNNMTLDMLDPDPVVSSFSQTKRNNVLPHLEKCGCLGKFPIHH